MKAALVHAEIAPSRIPAAARMVERDLVPGFLGHVGARHGYWMVHRRTGNLLILTLWESAEHMDAAAADSAARHEAVGAELGVEGSATYRLDVAGAHEERLDQVPRVRWVRATWVEGLRPDQRGALPALFREAVPDQVRLHGFCASYWLVNPVLGSAVGFTFWEGAAEIRDSEDAARRRRRRIQAVLGCRVTGAAELEALGVASLVEPDAQAAGGAKPFVARTHLAALGTPVSRPPGTLLAMSGEQTDQVVVVVDGAAAIVDGADLLPLTAGDHFGGSRIVARRRHEHAVLATTDVEIGVLSRGDFIDLRESDPGAADELVRDDADR
ncbi:MAG: cyclic nucleotide-binding domain-containing protein [Microthrixaceae bacterium]